MVRISFCLFFVLLPTVFAGEDLWVASIQGGQFESQLLASRYGYTIVKKLDLDENLYVLKRDNRISISKRSHEIYRSEKVNWIERQKPLIRQKRGIYSWLSSKYGREFNDDLWHKEWYLQDYRSRTTLPVLDMNVVPCYREGITGKGINVAVVDDGLEKDHIDLKDNFNPLTSYDFNEDKPDPTPRYDGYGSNAHGTKCAGEISMVANNKVCGVGIAYNSSIGGIKILDGNPTDLIESTALTYALDKIDVYSCSWGPADDGMTMERPGQLLELGFEAGINKGRNGKGVIYIFASGNGKTYGDNCAADGYILSIYTVPIASASQRGKTVSYGERCSAIMATAYSSGGNRDERVATTNINNTCTVRHSGTSAAAPLAAGIAALVLQANPNITWRDFQHLVAWTSEVSPLSGNNGWMLNGFDFWYSMDFGFGLLNAHSMVQHARTFATVPPKKICIVPIRIFGDKTLKKGSVYVVKVATKSCYGESMEINFLEHVQLITTIRYPKRGSISVFLTSPSGTKSALLEERFRDSATSGLVRWSLMSVHFWGENPRGVWTLTIKTKPDDDEEFVEMKGSVRSLRLVFHGTEAMPDHYRKGPRRYESFMMYPRGPKYFSKYT